MASECTASFSSSAISADIWEAPVRLSSKDAREFHRLASGFGWQLVGLTSNGHLRWTHPRYGELVTSATPRSWWWARRDLYSAMDMQMPPGSVGRPGRRARTRQQPNQINFLLRKAHQRQHRMDVAFAEKLLADSDGNLAQAGALLETLLDRADQVKAKREAAERRRQPWHPRRRSLTTVA